MSISQINPSPMSHPDDGQPVIIQVPPARRLEALAAMLPGDRRDLSNARRFMAYAENNAIPLELMFAVLGKRGRLVLASLAVPSAGRTAMLFHTSPRNPAEVPTIGRLISHACQETSRRDIAIAQVLVERGAQLERSALELGGFVHLADLSYLEMPFGVLPEAPPPAWPDDHTVEQYDPAAQADWVAALNATYVDTLDCPGLLGRRRTEDILNGHLGTGRFDPELWHMLRIDRKPAGVIMFNPSASGDSIELVYTGLAREARGRGLGRTLLHDGLHSLRGRLERTITLAVDEANVPALRLYSLFGFRRMLRRIAMIRPLEAIEHN